MSDSQNDTPAASPAEVTPAASTSEAIDQAFAEVAEGAPAADAKEPEKAAEAPKEEAKPEPKKSASDPIAKAIRAEREALRKTKEAERITAELDEFRSVLKAKDIAKIQDLLEKHEVTFADLVKFNLEADSAKTPEQQLAAQVKQLEAKLTEREKAEKEREEVDERTKYESNERDALDFVGSLVKAKPDAFKLCAQLANDAELRETLRIDPYREALLLVDRVWTEQGKQPFDNAGNRFDDAVTAALEHVEGRIKKLQAKLAPPQSEPAKQPENDRREQTSAGPSTISSTIGSRGVQPSAPVRTRIPSRDEAIDEALREAGIRA